MILRNIVLLVTGLALLISSLILQNLQILKFVECLQNSFLLGECSSSPISKFSLALIVAGALQIALGSFKLLTLER